MKDILGLLVLLSVHTCKVWPQPYQVGPDGNCLNSKTEYRLEGSNLCCKKCFPGFRLTKQCSENTDTQCERCPTGQYMESMNYSPKCLSCSKCKPVKGLQYAQNCSSNTRSRCGCQSGMYCIMTFDAPYCEACAKYRSCKVGYGVSVPGTNDSDVMCKPCPDGTFSDKVSYTDPCRPHTSCPGRVVRKGNSTADTVCRPEAFMSHNTQSLSSKEEPPIGIGSTHTSPAMTTGSLDGYRPTGATLPISISVSEASFNHSTKSPPSNTVSDSELAIYCITAVLLLLIAISVLICWKIIGKKDAARFHPKIDANGNCETKDQDFLRETQQFSFTVTSPEQRCLLEKVEACSDHSQSSNNTESLTRTEDCSSCESNAPLQSTFALQGPHSALSEPMTLISSAEPVSPVSTPSSFPAQSSSQPSSPQIVSPVTSPQVNVNITFHIGNGSARTPSVMPMDLVQADSQLPFGEEESFSIPQQEAGKQSLMSVQESVTLHEESST